MNITKREKDLIINALYIMECQCFGNELDHDITLDLGVAPDSDEVRDLMNKIKKVKPSIKL